MQLASKGWDVSVCRCHPLPYQYYVPSNLAAAPSARWHGVPEFGKVSRYAHAAMHGTREGTHIEVHALEFGTEKSGELEKHI